MSHVSVYSKINKVTVAVSHRCPKQGFWSGVFELHKVSNRCPLFNIIINVYSSNTCLGIYAHFKDSRITYLVVRVYF